MDSRERVIRAIEFESPDRIPITNGALPEAFLKYGEGLNRIFNEYRSDFGYNYVPSIYPDKAYFLGKRKTYLDEWGCKWLMVQRGILGQVKGHPLKDWESITSYRFPKLPERKYCISGGVNLFERMVWLRGFGNLMVDLIKKTKEVFILRDKIIDYNLEVIVRFLESNFDGICFLDDTGTQNGLMIKPSLWREFLKLSYKRMFDKVHRFGKHVFFHSDGYIMDIIPDLIEIGVDALWEPELQINGIDALADKFGGKICFVGSLDTQRILPFGSVEDIDKHVRHAIHALGSYDGGFIGDCEVHSDIPLNNVRAMFKAFIKYGRYPLANV